MAQHYQVKDKKILKSIARIAPKVYGDLKAGLTMDWCYWGKLVQHLPKEYNPNGYAFLISPYNMAKAWQNEPYAEEKAKLEVHLNKNGTIEQVYYPL